jgi:hypothetical protein
LGPEPFTIMARVKGYAAPSSSRDICCAAGRGSSAGCWRSMRAMMRGRYSASRSIVMHRKPRGSRPRRWCRCQRTGRGRPVRWRHEPDEPPHEGEGLAGGMRYAVDLGSFASRSLRLILEDWEVARCPAAVGVANPGPFPSLLPDLSYSDNAAIPALLDRPRWTHAYAALGVELGDGRGRLAPVLGVRRRVAEDDVRRPPARVRPVRPARKGPLRVGVTVATTRQPLARELRASPPGRVRPDPRGGDVEGARPPLDHVGGDPWPCYYFYGNGLAVPHSFS